MKVLKEQIWTLKALVGIYETEANNPNETIVQLKEEIQSLKRENKIQKAKVAVKELTLINKQREIDKLYGMIEELKKDNPDKENTGRSWPYEGYDIEYDTNSDRCLDGTEHEYPDEWNDTILSSPPCKKCGLVKKD